MGSRKKPKTESLCLLLLLLNPHPAVVYNSAFLTVTDIFIFALSTLPLAQCCHKLSTLYLCKSWPPRRELHVILNLPTVRSLWLSLTDDTAPCVTCGRPRSPPASCRCWACRAWTPRGSSCSGRGSRWISQTAGRTGSICNIVIVIAWNILCSEHCEQTARKIFGRWADFEMFVMMFSFYSTVKRYRHIK